MNQPAHQGQDQGKATVHDTSCAQRIRVLRLAAAGDPAQPPARLLHAIAAEIRECCGHPPLRAHRLAWGLTVTTALRALRARPGASPNLSNRSWQDWETGQRPGRRNQDLLCQMFSTGPVELGFSRDYRDPASPATQETPGYTAGKGRPDERGPREPNPPAPLAARPTASSTTQESPGDTVRKGRPDEGGPREPNLPARLAARSAAEARQPAQAGPSTLAERSLLMDAAHESSEPAAGLESASVGPDALGQAGDDIIRIARAYAHTPPLPLYGELIQLRNRAYWLLDHTRQPIQQHDLYLIAGQACGLLASASFDLGYPRAAAEHARAARAYGQVIDHKELSAWADGTLSMLEYWAGRSHQALLLAERGLSVAPPGTSQVRLWCNLARAAALQGNEQRAIEAITASQRARDASAAPTELHDQAGGEFGFGLARQACCYSSAYLKLGQPDEALAESGQALELYAHGPADQRWFGTEAIARAEMATAHLLRGDVDGARDALGEVLALDPAKRVESVVRRLGTLRNVLAKPSFQHRQAQSLADEIEQFTATSANPALPAPPA